MPPTRIVSMFVFIIVVVIIFNCIFYIYYVNKPKHRQFYAVKRSLPHDVNSDYYLNNKEHTIEKITSEIKSQKPISTIKGLNTIDDLVVKREGLPLCPEPPPHLGPVSDDYVMRSIKAFDVLYSEVQIGGAYCPTNCVARHRVAIIVPFRNTKNGKNIRYLGTFMYIMHMFLIKQQLEYRIFVVEQAPTDNGTRLYNQGMLLNAAYCEVHRRRTRDFRFTCIIFHDPSIVPTDTRNLYTCSNRPKLLSSTLKKSDKSVIKLKFGRVLAIAMSQFIEVNGFSNIYWDNDKHYEDLYMRLINANYTIDQTNRKIGKYVKVKNFVEPVFNQSKMTVTYSPLNFIDGLTTVKYTVNNFVLKYIFTYINITLEDG